MKKVLALILVLLISFGALVFLMPWGMPGENLQQDALNLTAGQMAQIENRDFLSRIYFWREGSLEDIYTESRILNGRERNITQFCESGKNLAFLRVYSGEKDWEIVELKDGEPILFRNGSFKDPFTISGLYPSESGYWLTALDEEGGISIFEVTKEKFTLYGIIPAQWYPNTVSALYDGSQVHLTDSKGDQFLAELDVKRSQPVKKEHLAVPDLPSSSMDVLRYKSIPAIFALAVWLAVSVTILITAAISLHASRLAARLTAVGSELMLLGLTAVGTVSCVVVKNTAGLEASFKSMLISVPILLGIWLIATVLLRMTSAGIIRPLHNLKQQMKEISEGKIAPHTAPKGRDEISSMDRSMQEMLMDLSIRDYELESTIRCYQRFVPEKMTELLDRASVAEVSLGDNSSMVSNVGFFTISNRADARGLLDDDAFITFVNHSFKTLYSCIRDNHGSMLSNALRISAVEIMFPREASDGVRTGLDLLGNTFKRPREDIPAPKPFLMLHRASFIYGVSGEKERLFPYFSSSELEFLGSFAGDFHETNTQLVMTDAYLNELKDCQVSTRYIGFVSDGDSRTYKLYEILDGYPELERDLRLGYDKRFQEGIQLFYKNDFFLARNLFSDLLRACPGDGIVRWYLFACEHYFNSQGREEPDYRLFGIQEN